MLFFALILGPLYERDFSICYFHCDSSVPNNGKLFEHKRETVIICNNDSHKVANGKSVLSLTEVTNLATIETT